MKNYTSTRKFSSLVAVVGALTMSAPAFSEQVDEAEMPFGAAVIIIELTDNDIELQVFADAFDWTRVEIFDPMERKVFDVKARGRLQRQGGMSELFWASEPSHYLEDEDNYDESVEDFLERWPEGIYEFEGTTTVGVELESEAVFSHVLAALPVIVSPAASGTEDPTVVDINLPLVIDWEPVTTRYIGDGPIEIFEYQVIIAEEEPSRTMNLVDGGTRRALINLPPDVTELTVPKEFLSPGSLYEIEILAFATNGNSSISVVEFETSE